MSVDPLDSDPLILSQQSAPIRVVVCGEFSAGKSSVINTIIRANVAKSFIGEDIQPIMIVRSGEEAGTEKLFRDHHGELVEECEVTVTQDHLIGYELIEIPMGRDGEISDAGKSHIQSADVFIWVTIGSQAWRLTEKQVLDQIGDILPKHRILTVSRADKLRSKDDRKKLLDRLEAETSEYFQHIVFVKGAPKSIEASASSYDSWHDTRGKEIFDHVENWRDAINAERASARQLAEQAKAEQEELSRQRSENIIALKPIADAPSTVSTPPEHITNPIELPELAEPIETPVADPVPEAKPVVSDPIPETPVVTSLAKEPEPEVAPAPPLPSPEPSPADGLTTLKEIAQPYEAIICAGIASMDDTKHLHLIQGALDKTTATAQWCRSLFSNQLVSYRYDGVAKGDATTQIAMKNTYLVYRKLPNSSEIAFLMAETSQTSAGILYRCFDKICSAYAESDLSD